VRRFKSEHALSLGAEIQRLDLATADEELRQVLRAADPDLRSITRARQVRIGTRLSPEAQELAFEGALRVAVLR
jgi:hypothetical protein